MTLALPPPSSFRPQRPLTVGNQTVHGSSILVGVPHYVLFLRDDLWSQNIAPLGSAIRQHPDLRPDGGANVNFVTVRDCALDRGAHVRARRRGGDAFLRLRRRGLGGDERAVRQGASRRFRC